MVWCCCRQKGSERSAECMSTLQPENTTAEGQGGAVSRRRCQGGGAGQWSLRCLWAGKHFHRLLRCNGAAWAVEPAKGRELSWRSPSGSSQGLLMPMQCSSERNVLSGSGDRRPALTSGGLGPATVGVAGPPGLPERSNTTKSSWEDSRAAQRSRLLLPPGSAALAVLGAGLAVTVTVTAPCSLKLSKPPNLN